MNKDDKVISMADFRKTEQELKGDTVKNVTLADIANAGSPEKAMELFERNEEGKAKVPHALIAEVLANIGIDLFAICIMHPQFGDEAEDIAKTALGIIDVMEGKADMAPEDIGMAMIDVMERHKALSEKIDVASKVQ